MEKTCEVSFSSLPFPLDPDQTLHPWLLVSQGKNLQLHTLYSVSKNEHLKKNISEFRNKLILSTSYGWLAVIDLETSPVECCLMNPASKEKFQLPHIELESGWESRLFHCVLSKPPTDPDCHVLFLPPFDENFFFCRLGDEKYIKTCYPGDFFTAATNYNGKIIAWMVRSRNFVEVDFVGQELVFKQLLNNLGQPCQIPWPSPSTSSRFADYFVQSGGELLLVHLVCKHTSYEVSYFRIFKVDDCSELRSIGDRSIFLDPHGRSICCTSCDESRIRKNSIYFYWEQRYLYVYDIEDRTTTPVKPCIIKRNDRSLMSWVMM